jgi:NAD(P)-dependent dehydrogenase (short-subunit alcohol dehydrogenase family)
VELFPQLDGTPVNGPGGYTSQSIREAWRRRVEQKLSPLKKHLYPDDVAGAIAFLAGDEASMLTGSHILITGGSQLQL